MGEGDTQTERHTRLVRFKERQEKQTLTRKTANEKSNQSPTTPERKCGTVRGQVGRHWAGTGTVPVPKSRGGPAPRASESGVPNASRLMDRSRGQGNQPTATKCNTYLYTIKVPVDQVASRRVSSLCDCQMAKLQQSITQSPLQQVGARAPAVI